MPDRCPTHPWHPLDPCPQCEALIEQRELLESDPPDADWQADRAADRYEKWLSR